MAEKVSRWVKFKRFLKRNMTLSWFKRFIYQILSLLLCVALVIGVAEYAVMKTYDEMELVLMEDFTITAHTGAFDTRMNSVESVKAAVDNNVEILEIDIRQRPDGTVVMSHDIVFTNRDGVELSEALELIKPTDIKINLDIKETTALDALYDLLVKYDLLGQSFLTGIERRDVDAVRESKCADMDYYLNYAPSRTKIFMDDYRQELIVLLEDTGAIGINCNYQFVSSQLSNLLHKHGYKLSAWTIDSERKAKKVLVRKVDNITTRDPELVKKVIENWGK